MKKKTIQVRVDEDEYAVMVSAAEEEGVVFSEWVRRRLRGSLMDDVEPDAFRSEAPKVPVKKMSAGIQEINKHTFKPGVSIDQFGNKRSLAKPGKK